MRKQYKYNYSIYCFLSFKRDEYFKFLLSDTTLINLRYTPVGYPEITDLGVIFVVVWLVS